MTEYFAVIDRIAEKLQIPAEQLLVIIPMIGVKFVIKSILSAAVFAFSCYKLTKLINACTDDFNPDDAIKLVAYGLMLLMSGGVLFLSITNAILWIYDKNVWAVSYIFELVK